MPDEKGIFIRNHTLTDHELSKQFAERWRIDPTSEATLEFRSRTLAVIHGQGEEATPSEINPFPEGMNEKNAPEVVKNSWEKVQKYKVPLEKQSKISYYEKNGEWFINLDGTKISLQNESATSNPSEGINVVEGNTYFSRPAVQKHASSKGRALPTNALWTKMAEFLGGVKQLKDILQFPLAGSLLSSGGQLHVAGDYAGVWSSDGGVYLRVYAGGGFVFHSVVLGFSHSVRLLDN